VMQQQPREQLGSDNAPICCPTCGAGRFCVSCGAPVFKSLNGTGAWVWMPDQKAMPEHLAMQQQHMKQRNQQPMHSMQRVNRQQFNVPCPVGGPDDGFQQMSYVPQFTSNPYMSDGNMGAQEMPNMVMVPMMMQNNMQNNMQGNMQHNAQGPKHGQQGNMQAHSMQISPLYGA